jgi:hypothetical protein
VLLEWPPSRFTVCFTLAIPFMTSLSLYRRILGERFDALPEVLRRFHGSPAGGRARGTFRVERAEGRLRNAVAALLGMPESSQGVPVCLDVNVEGGRERWCRLFGERRLVTVQWAMGDLLMESLGLVSFSSALELEGPCLRNEFRRAWFAGIPIPRWISPTVTGSEVAGDSGWRVEVHIMAPFLGEIVRYEGWVELE